MTDNELNSLVAERVMGCDTIAPHHRDKRAACHCSGLPHGMDTDGHIPDYANDIAAAFQVESRIKELGIQDLYVAALSQIVAPEYASIFTSAIEFDLWAMELDGHAYLWLMVTATAKQRCLAALMAVGIEVGK